MAQRCDKAWQGNGSGFGDRGEGSAKGLGRGQPLLSGRGRRSDQRAGPSLRLVGNCIPPTESLSSIYYGFCLAAQLCSVQFL